MPDPKRYAAKTPWYAIETFEHPIGEFVLYADYASLKAQAEMWEKNTQLMGKQLNDELAENARLKAEVKRLTKAGDAMLRAIKVSDPVLDCKIELWNSAKEDNR